MSVPEVRNQGTGKRRMPPFVVRFGKWQATLDLTPTQHLVAITLALYADGEGRGARPPAARLAGDAGLSERAVREALAVLLHRGVIRVTRPGGGRGYATEYALRNGDAGSGISPETLNRTRPNGEPSAPETLNVVHAKRTREEVEEETRMREVRQQTRAALLADGVMHPIRPGDRRLLDEEVARRRASTSSAVAPAGTVTQAKDGVAPALGADDSGG